MEISKFINKVPQLIPFIESQGNKLLIEEEPAIKDMNIRRLYDTGLDTKDIPVGFYTKETVQKRRAAGKPVPGDMHWMSFWKGDYFKEIKLEELKQNELEIKSDFYGSDAMEKHDPDYLGLTDRQCDQIGKIIADQLTTDIVNFFS